jgi:hypothetical protein
MKTIMDYEVRQFADGRTMVVACPRRGQLNEEMCDEVRDIASWSLAELRDLHRHEFGGAYKFGRCYFVPFTGATMEITPIGLVK